MITVKSVEGIQDKSTAEIEAEMLKQHEEKVNTASEETAPAVEISKEEETSYPEVELSDEQVFKYLGTKLNKSISSLDDLVEKEDLPDDIKTIWQFKKETGRGIQDFLKATEDIDSLDEKSLIKKYLKETQPELDDEDVETQMTDYFTDDFDDESDIKKKTISAKKMLKEAKKYFEDVKEKYKMPLESMSVGLPESDKVEFESYKQYKQQAKQMEEDAQKKSNWFTKKTKELFNDEFKGFGFEINNKVLKFAPADKSELIIAHSSPMNFIGKFLDEQGMLKDSEGYHKALAVAMNPDKFAKYFYEQGKSDGIESYDATIKNTKMSEHRLPEVQSKGGMVVKAVNPDTGSRLKIKSGKS